jgi:hypothetical protein
VVPPGSSCSIQIGKGLTDVPLGFIRNVYLVVTNLQAARNRLRQRGVEVSEIRHKNADWSLGRSFRAVLDLPVETMPASPTSPTPMAIAGC